MIQEGYRLWFGKCNDFNLHGVFSRDGTPEVPQQLAEKHAHLFLPDIVKEKQIVEA